MAKCDLRHVLTYFFHKDSVRHRPMPCMESSFTNLPAAGLCVKSFNRLQQGLKGGGTIYWLFKSRFQGDIGNDKWEAV